jgi:hypothetical protein
LITPRKATARAKTTADPYGMTNQKAQATTEKLVDLGAGVP